ncbi:MAG TPA: biotin transporter BioY [Candidatus Polarisedimenticolia bacterium]|nr:biotin transporter BioY [Candidatus Polarisedimenticolia bacterium]
MSLVRTDTPGSMNEPSGAATTASARPLDRAVVRLALVFFFAVLTWIGARISVPLPGTPVPATVQTLAVLLAGAFLGRRAGFASQALYILIGAAGLPVFALPGAGPTYLLGPTGGYLLGFVAAAWVVGSLLERGGRRGVPRVAAAFFLGAATIHLCGLGWLSVVLGDPAAALRAGVFPFVLFDLAKVVIATGVYSGYLRWKPGIEP